MEDKKDGELRLQVSVRHVHSEDGSVNRERRVRCPDQQHLVDVKECAGCPRLQELYLEGWERKSFVTCRPETPQGEALDARDRISSLMSTNLVCIRPEMNVEAALDLLLEEHISSAPVVDGEGKLLGIVARTDLLAVKNQERAAHLVGSIMMPLVFSLCETASVATAARLMTSEGIHRLLVTSLRGELVGIVSSLDVVRWVAEHEGAP